MRASSAGADGARVRVFNGEDGEWACVLAVRGKSAMLMPTDRGSASDTGARTWRKNFLQSSGFNCIIDFLMQHMGGEGAHFLRRQGVVKHCLSILWYSIL